MSSFLPPLVFATHNANKAAEIKAALGHLLTIQTLAECGITQEIPEPHDTLEANALEKAQTIFALTGKDCFSEDTGLEVAALGGAPGVKSARYAGEGRDATANWQKLLTELEGQTQRQARFRTVVALVWQGQTHLFEGICEGEILSAPSGEGGFGYDPVFCPAGAQQSFATMSMAEKNQYSHRRKAMEKAIAFLQSALQQG